MPGVSADELMVLPFALLDMCPVPFTSCDLMRIEICTDPSPWVARSEDGSAIVLAARLGEAFDG